MAWISGPDGAVQFRNRRWVEYTGLSQLGKAEEAGRIAVHPEDRDRTARQMDASFASGEPFEEEMRIRRADGEYRWFLSRAVPLRDKRGRVVKWYGAATDIQDRKRAEQLQADLAHTNRVSILGELVASISHELAQLSPPQSIMPRHLCGGFSATPRSGASSQRNGKNHRSGYLCLGNHQPFAIVVQEGPSTREVVAINEIIGEMVRLLPGEPTRMRFRFVRVLPPISPELRRTECNCSRS
jgi:PAS domain S-box-containing protein